MQQNGKSVVDAHRLDCNTHLGLLHVRICVSGKLLDIVIALASVFSHLKSEALFSEPQILSGNKARQEDVDALPYTEGQRNDTVCPRLTVEAADEV